MQWGKSLRCCCSGVSAVGAVGVFAEEASGVACGLEVGCMAAGDMGGCGARGGAALVSLFSGYRAVDREPFYCLLLSVSSF